MSTLEKRFELVDELDRFILKKETVDRQLRDLLNEVSQFLWDLCACRPCGAHGCTRTMKLSCQFCTVCGQHRDSPEVEA